MEKVLITGGAGFIGSHVVDKFIEKNYEIIIIDNLSTGTLENLTAHNNNTNIKFYHKDILTDDISDIFKSNKPDYCIHLAAQTNVSMSMKDPIGDLELNIIATLKILDLCNMYDVKKIICASSAAVYGTPNQLPIDENHPTEPISNYGISKLTMEKYVQLTKFPHISFRIANVYGPRQINSPESGVITIFHHKMLNNEDINIFGNGEQIRDFVYVEDIANAIVETMINDKITNEVINISTNTGVSLNELFTQMAKIYQYKLKPNYLPNRNGDIKDSILSNAKLKKYLPNFKTTTLKEGLIKLKKHYT